MAKAADGRPKRGAAERETRSGRIVRGPSRFVTAQALPAGSEVGAVVAEVA
uniref:Uncharacterized protein n=1 Tax=Arundo donax TaxID=35708 RepID=A0A0A9BN07_ARUDO